MTPTMKNTGCIRMNENQIIMQEAQKMVDDNLTQCCIELLDWQNTGLLITDGYIRDISAILKRITPTNSLALTESMVKTSAMKKVAELSF